MFFHVVKRDRNTETHTMMKSISITLAIALIIVIGAVVVNHFNAETDQQVADISIDLNQTDVLDDLVFDKDGHLIAGTSYKWNTKDDTRGEIIATLQCN